MIKKLFIALSLFILPLAAHAATGDIAAVTVNGPNLDNAASTTYNGWTADVRFTGFTSSDSTTFSTGMGTTTLASGDSSYNNPANAKMIFTVTSNGYTSAGVLASTSRTIYGTWVVRKPYPLNTSFQESTGQSSTTVRYSLSDYIYQNETVTGVISAGIFTDNGTGGTSGVSNASTSVTVTNLSTMGYPKAIGRWSYPAYERVTGAFPVEATIFDKFAQNGKPLAAVVFSAADTHGNTAYATVTDMTISTRGTPANPITTYVGTIPVTTLTNGDVLTVNFKGYPWVGTTTAINSDLVGNGGDGFAQPDERLGPITYVNDKSQNYGGAFAVVDDTNGLDTNATTYCTTTQALAESDYNGNSAHSYKSIGRAAAALKAFNNAQYSRNEPGNAVILLNNGNHLYVGTTPADSGVMNTWLTVRPMSTVTQAQAIINGSGTFQTDNVRLMKIDGVTITVSGAAGIDGNATNATLWLNNTIVNSASSPTFDAWKEMYYVDSTVQACGDCFHSYGIGNTNPTPMVRGNTVVVGATGSAVCLADQYNVIGNVGICNNRYLDIPNIYSQQLSDNTVWAYNSLMNTSGAPITSGSATWGHAWVQNVIESQSVANPIWQDSAPTNQASTSNNVILWYNTFAGARQNGPYNAFGCVPYPQIQWDIDGNQLVTQSMKTDVTNSFDTPCGGRTGNWGPLYGVGQYGNKEWISQGFEGPFLGLFWAGPGQGVQGFRSDRSLFGNGAGNGIYAINSNSVSIGFIPAGKALLPFDFIGHVRYNDGRGAAGAYEYDPAVRTLKGAYTLKGSYTIK